MEESRDNPRRPSDQSEVYEQYGANDIKGQKGKSLHDSLAPIRIF